LRGDFVIERISRHGKGGAVLVLLLTALGSWGAELKPEATQAFDRYIAENERRIEREQSKPGSFLSVSRLPEAQRAEAEARLRRGEILIEKQEGTPVRLPGALLHHWIGTVFVPGATLQSTLALVQDYDRLGRYYRPEVIDSRLLARHGDDFHIFMRLRKQKVITVVLDTEYDVHYGRLDSSHAYSRSRSTRVTEIANPGEKGEHALTEKDGHGFLWRLNSYWQFVQIADGVMVQCEAISLTRDVPAGLGWLIEPFVQSLPRESLEFTLRATRDAVRNRGPHN
jgi:hypothetical protein